MKTKLTDLIRFASDPWPGRALSVQPGDLSTFVQQGLGLKPPTVFRTWDQLSANGQRNSYYGLDTPSAHPLRNAPTNDAAGGIVYFDDSPDRDSFDAMLRLMQVGTRSVEYLAFWEKSENPLEDRFVEQIRFMAPYAIGLFGASMTNETRALAKQQVTLGDALWAFVEDQQERYGQHAFPPELGGMLGGDGDWAKESLAYGFMVENSYNQVFRIWSRAWLVTK